MSGETCHGELHDEIADLLIAGGHAEAVADLRESERHDGPLSNIALDWARDFGIVLRDDFKDDPILHGGRTPTAT